MRHEDSGRDRIIQVARQLFTERGFSDVSMQQIAVAAGLRKASIYHHFASKVDLFVAVSWLEIDDLHAQTAAAATSADDLPSQLVAIAEAWLQSIRGDRGRLMREFQEFVPIPQQLELDTRMQSFLGTIAEAFGQAAARGELRDIEPLTAATYFTDLVSGAVYRMYLQASDLDDREIRRLATDVVTCFLYGVAAPALAPPAAVTPPPHCFPLAVTGS